MIFFSKVVIVIDIIVPNVINVVGVHIILTIANLAIIIIIIINIVVVVYNTNDPSFICFTWYMYMFLIISVFFLCRIISNICDLGQ